MNRHWRSVILELAFLAGILAIGAYLRLVNLRTNPGWYPDEGSDLNMAWNLLHGRFQYFAVGGSLLVAARAPLYLIILSGLIRIFGYDILVARVLTAIVGVAAIPLVHLVFRDPLGKWRSLSTAGLFAVFPLAVLYSRWSFGYNLLVPIYLVFFWSLYRLMQTGGSRWVLLAAICASLAILTAWVAVSLLICFALVGWAYNRKSLLWGLPLAILPSLIFLAISDWSSPAAFSQDLALTFSRTGGSLPVQFLTAAVSYSIFIGSNYWFAPCIIGLFLIESAPLRRLVFWVFFVTLFSVLRFALVAELGFYRLLELLPFFVLGATTFLWRAIPFALGLVSGDVDRAYEKLSAPPAVAHLVTRFGKVALVSTFVYLVIVGVLTIALVRDDFLSVVIGYSTRIDSVLAVPTEDAVAAVEYVNRSADPQDVVLASPQLAWAINARVTDFQQSLSYEGAPTDNYPIPVKRERFVFDPTPDNARFAIVDPMWREWAVGTIPAMKGLLNSVELWPVAYRSGDYVVYQNPRR